MRAFLEHLARPSFSIAIHLQPCLPSLARLSRRRPLTASHIGNTFRNRCRTLASSETELREEAETTFASRLIDSNFESEQVRHCQWDHRRESPSGSPGEPPSQTVALDQDSSRLKLGNA